MADPIAPKPFDPHDQRHEPVQLLGPDGEWVTHPDYSPLLASDQLLSAYQHMVVTRRLDQEFINLQRQGQLALYASCRGQEAAQVATAVAVRSTDHLFPQYRELGCFVVRGVDVAAMGRYWRGVWHSADDFLPRRISPLTIPIATHLPHAVGWAMGANLDGTDEIAVGFCGDGATSEGDFHEALNFAAVFEAPVVFVIQNNQWAISVPVAHQTRAATLADKAVGYGLPGVVVDGNDLVACHAVVGAAAARARAGGGPTVVEMITYRMEAHTTSDDPSRYRSDDEVQAWSQRDPLERVARRLRAEGTLDADAEARVDAAAAAVVDAVRAGTWDAPADDALRLFDSVYAVPPSSLTAQRVRLADELARDAASPERP